MIKGNEFLIEISKGKGCRRSFEKILAAHLKTFPEYKNQPDYAKHLFTLIESLDKQGKVILPSIKGRSWRDSNPRLPLWIKINKTKENKGSIVPLKYAWHPKLASFIDELRTSQKEAAYKISEYLKQHKENGQFEYLIPRRERSLKIFGDEKKLDSLSKKGDLFGGNLSLENLGCYDVSWPMPFNAPSPPNPNKPFLIIENHHTFESFSKWNNTSRAYSGVGYGAGEAFSTLESDRIENIVAPLKASEILYFGDLDPKGISIPARVNNARTEKNMLPILPAVDLYEWLLNNGVRRPLGKGKQRSYISGWLPVLLEKKISQLFLDSVWLPQEALGSEELISGLIRKT